MEIIFHLAHRMGTYLSVHSLWRLLFYFIFSSLGIICVLPFDIEPRFMDLFAVNTLDSIQYVAFEMSSSTWVEK